MKGTGRDTVGPSLFSFWKCQQPVGSEIPDTSCPRLIGIATDVHASGRQDIARPCRADHRINVQDEVRDFLHPPNDSNIRAKFSCCCDGTGLAVHKVGAGRLLLGGRCLDDDIAVGLSEQTTQFLPGMVQSSKFVSARWLWTAVDKSEGKGDCRRCGRQSGRWTNQGCPNRNDNPPSPHTVTLRAGRVPADPVAKRLTHDEV